MNDVNITFTNCDGNPQSHLTLFGDFGELKPSTYLFDVVSPFCSRLFSSLEVNPSHRVMPVDYFAFMEVHFGGCGCYSQTDGRNSIEGTFSAAIGFRWAPRLHRRAVTRGVYSACLNTNEISDEHFTTVTKGYNLSTASKVYFGVFNSCKFQLTKSAFRRWLLRCWRRTWMYVGRGFTRYSQWGAYIAPGGQATRWHSPRIQPILGPSATSIQKQAPRKTNPSYGLATPPNSLGFLDMCDVRCCSTE